MSRSMNHEATVKRVSGERCRFATAALIVLILFAPATVAAEELSLTIEQPSPIVVFEQSLELSGTSSAPPGSEVRIVVNGQQWTTQVAADGSWLLSRTPGLPTGTYLLRVEVTDEAGRQAVVESDLRIELEEEAPRRPMIPRSIPPGSAAETLRLGDFVEFPNRWGILQPRDYEIIEPSRGRWDPYNQNILKGDRPIRGEDIFLSLAGISDSIFEGRTVPVPAAVSTDRPGSKDFFGEGNQLFFRQDITLGADLYRGLTTFRPADWRARVTLVANINHLDVRETTAVSPDVRRGTDRTDGQLGVQELFYERKLRDLTPNFDFVSIRGGVQPFVSDFRGFIYNDSNLGLRLFGNYASNRYQYNLAFFDRLEKDTNSGLNTLQRRRQQVAIANFYAQDFIHPGYTAQLSAHYLRDQPSVHYDSNGFLVRPDPIGDFVPHEINATYLGWTGFGKIERLNLDHALYYVFGRDSHNPIAGADPIGGGAGPGGVAPARTSVDIGALMAAVEISYDRDWYRPRLSWFHASGDGNIRDRKARGFDAIFPAPNFAGGEFGFWNSLGIRLAGTAVGLVHPGSLIPDLSSSRDEGQPNFVNPGIHIFSGAFDVEVTPRSRLVFTHSYLRFDRTEVLEGMLFQGNIGKEIGHDISLGIRHRPFLNNNVVLLGGVAVLLPGSGFGAIYEDRTTLYNLITRVIFAF
jgi:hypothetical protein